MKIINLKKTILLVLPIIVTTVANAQVTIGSNAEPSSAAILEIKTMHNASHIVSITDDSNITSDKGGLGLPRVKLVNRKTLEPFIQGSIDDQTKMKHVGLTVYNIKQQITNSIDESFEPGTYVWDGKQWNMSGSRGSEGARWFYLPPFHLSITLGSANSGEIKLHDIYKNQFTQTGNGAFISSDTSINTIPSPLNGKLYENSELYYVVTYYDTSIMSIAKIDPDGTMYYTTNGKAPTTKSYINVIAIVK